MNRFLSIAAAVLVAAVGGVMILGASPQVQDESKADKVIKSLTEKVEKLEKRVAELEKKLAAVEKKSSSGFEGLLEKFGKFEGFDNLKKKLDEFRDQAPEMPDFENFQGMDMDQLLEMLKGQLEGQFPGFFDGLDLEGLFEQFKGGMPAPEKKKKDSNPKRRSISF